MGLYGRVYDFASFLDEHPAGPTSISDLGGADGTVRHMRGEARAVGGARSRLPVWPTQVAFEHIHNEAMLSEFDDVLIGRLKA